MVSGVHLGHGANAGESAGPSGTGWAGVLMKQKMSDLIIALGYASRHFTAMEEDEKRDALFVRHWAPTFFILGVGAENREYRRQNTLALDADA